MVAGKRGWIRITEAVLSILILAGVLLIMFGDKQPVGNLDYITPVNVEILNLISQNDTLRKSVFDNNFLFLGNFVDSHIGRGLNYTLEICDLEIDVEQCSQSDSDFPIKKEIFTNEQIITNHRVYSSEESKNNYTFGLKVLKIHSWQE